MPQLHRLPPPRVLVTIPSHLLNLPTQNPTCKSMPPLHSFTSPSLLVTIPSHFLNLPHQNPTCKSMPQLHSFTSPRLLVTIPRHVLNLPLPKPYMQHFSSTSQPLLSKTSCHDSKSFFKPRPPQNLSCKNIYWGGGSRRTLCLSLFTFSAGVKMNQDFAQVKCRGRLIHTWAPWCLPFLPRILLLIMNTSRQVPLSSIRKDWDYEMSGSTDLIFWRR